MALFIHKKTGIKLSDDDLAKLYEETKWNTFRGLRKDLEYPYYVDEDIKMKDKAELSEFLEEDSEVIGTFDYYHTKDGPLTETSEERYLFCFELENIKAESQSKNTITFLKKEIFAGVDDVEFEGFIDSIIGTAKGVCFTADWDKEVAYLNDSNKLLKERDGVLYSSLDFFIEKKTYQNPMVPAVVPKDRQMGPKSAGSTKYSNEERNSVVGILIERMVGANRFNNRFVDVLGSTKNYLNMLSDENLEAIMELYRVKLVN